MRTKHIVSPVSVKQAKYVAEEENYSTLSGLIRLVVSLECFIEITPDFLCPFMNDLQLISEPQLLAVCSYSCLNLYNFPYTNVRFLPVTPTYII